MIVHLAFFFVRLFTGIFGFQYDVISRICWVLITRCSKAPRLSSKAIKPLGSLSLGVRLLLNEEANGIVAILATPTGTET